MMKVEIHNLGAVKEAKINLKPLTIFVGANNAGKTWTAYTLSTVIGKHAMEQYSRAYAAGDISRDYPPLGAALQKIAEEGNATVDIVELATQYGSIYIKKLTDFAQNGMQEFMGTRKVSFDKLKIDVDFEHTKEQFLERIRKIPFEKDLVSGQQSWRPLLKALKEKGEGTLYFYTEAEGSVLDELPLRAVKAFLVETIFELFHSAFNNSDYPYLYTFPTERTSYATFSLNALDFLASLEKEIQQRDKGDNMRPESVISFDKMLMDVFRTGNQSNRKEQVQSVLEIGAYIRLAELLEKEILGGKVDFSTPKPEPWRELLFQASDNLKSDMPVASSMIKELSPLVLYLRYLAKPNERIIIDEPEMNLHPKAQAQMTELLAMLVHAGLQVLITTHSPYIVDHLVNLMAAAEHKNKEVIQDKFYLQRTEAFISKEDVSVYLFEDGTAKNILDEEEVIEWGTFADISEQVNDLYFQIARTDTDDG